MSDLITISGNGKKDRKDFGMQSPVPPYDFSNGLSVAQTRAVQELLAIVFGNSQLDQIALTGSLATRYWASQVPFKFPWRSLTNIDFVARDLNAVSPAIVHHLLVAYYKPEYMLLYKGIRHREIGIHIFTQAVPDEREVVEVNFNGTIVRVVTLERLLANITADIMKVKTVDIDDQQFKDAALLVPYADRDALAYSWDRLYRGKDLPVTWDAAYNKAFRLRDENPSRIVSDPYQQPKYFRSALPNAFLGMAVTCAFRVASLGFNVHNWRWPGVK